MLKHFDLYEAGYPPVYTPDADFNVWFREPCSPSDYGVTTSGETSDQVRGTVRIAFPPNADAHLVAALDHCLQQPGGDNGKATQIVGNGRTYHVSHPEVRAQRAVQAAQIIRAWLTWKRYPEHPALHFFFDQFSKSVPGIEQTAAAGQVAPTAEADPTFCALLERTSQAAKQAGASRYLWADYEGDELMSVHAEQEAPPDGHPYIEATPDGGLDVYARSVDEVRARPGDVRKQTADTFAVMVAVDPPGDAQEARKDMQRAWSKSSKVRQGGPFAWVLDMGPVRRGTFTVTVQARKAAAAKQSVVAMLKAVDLAESAVVDLASTEEDILEPSDHPLVEVLGYKVKAGDKRVIQAFVRGKDAKDGPNLRIEGDYLVGATYSTKQPLAMRDKRGFITYIGDAYGNVSQTWVHAVRKASKAAGVLKESLTEDFDAAPDTVSIVEMLAEAYNPDHNYNDPNRPLAKQYTQYIHHGNTFKPAGPGVFTENLGRSAYRIVMSMQGVEFHRTKAQTDELYHFENSVMEDVLHEIDKFWDLRENYAKFGVLFSRGVLLEGGPGNGKSALIQQVAEMMVKRGDVVFFVNSIRALKEGLRAFREVESQRPVVVVLEDADEHLQYDQRQFLQLLDGDDKVSGVLYLATTNYLDRFPERLRRPGRFDKIVNVPPPPLEGRQVYLEHKLKDVEKSEEIKRLALATEGMSFGHLREFVISAYVLKNPKDETIRRLRAQTGIPDPGIKEAGEGGLIHADTIRAMGEDLDEAVIYLSDEGSDKTQAEVLAAVKRSGLPLRVRKAVVNTSGGMRKSTTVAFKGKTATDNEYDRFLGLRDKMAGHLRRGPRVPGVSVEGKPEHGSFRVVHTTDVPESLDEGTKGPYPFTDKEAQYRGYTLDQLRHAQRDASKAKQAMRGHDPEAEGWYADDVFTITTELRKREQQEQIKAAWKAELVRRYKPDPKAEYYVAPGQDKEQLAQRTIDKMWDPMRTHGRHKGALTRNPALKAAAKKVGVKTARDWNALFESVDEAAINTHPSRHWYVTVRDLGDDYAKVKAALERNTGPMGLFRTLDAVRDRRTGAMSLRLLVPASNKAGAEQNVRVAVGPHTTVESLDEAKKREHKRRQAWMRDYEQELTKLDPKQAGRVDWDTATYLFNTGKDAKAAARKVANFKPVGESLRLQNVQAEPGWTFTVTASTKAEAAHLYEQLRRHSQAQVALRDPAEGYGINGFVPKSVASTPLAVRQQIQRYVPTVLGESVEVAEARVESAAPVALWAVRCEAMDAEEANALRRFLSSKRASIGVQKVWAEDTTVYATVQGPTSVEGARGAVESLLPEFHQSYADGDLRPTVTVAEVSPPGFSGTTKAMKKHGEIDNPWALAWHLYKKGAKPKYKPEKGKPGYVSPKTYAARQARKAAAQPRKLAASADIVSTVGAGRIEKQLAKFEDLDEAKLKVQSVEYSSVLVRVKDASEAQKVYKHFDSMRPNTDRPVDVHYGLRSEQVFLLYPYVPKLALQHARAGLRKINVTIESIGVADSKSKGEVAVTIPTDHAREGSQHLRGSSESLTVAQLQLAEQLSYLTTPAERFRTSDKQTEVKGNKTYFEPKGAFESLDEAAPKAPPYTDDTAEAFAAKVKAGVRAPWTLMDVSRLGSRASVILKLSLDKKEDWNYGILHNSRYALFHLHANGKMEQFAKHHKLPKFRKQPYKDAKQAIAKINKWIAQAASIQEQYTPGLRRALAQQRTHAQCDDCGFHMPVYKGRYPSKCPHCEAPYGPVDVVAQEDDNVSVAEAAEVETDPISKTQYRVTLKGKMIGMVSLRKGKWDADTYEKVRGRAMGEPVAHGLSSKEQAVQVLLHHREENESLPEALDEGGKPVGKAQQGIMRWLKAVGGKGRHALSDVPYQFTKSHFSRTMSAAEALKKKGLIDYDGTHVSVKESLDEAFNPNASPGRTGSGKTIPALDAIEYRTGYKFPKMNVPVAPTSTASAAHAAKALRRNLSGWSKQDHLDAAVAHTEVAKRAEKEWSRVRDKEHRKVFGMAPGFGDYKVSGIGRTEYSPKVKDRLRSLAHGQTKHETLAAAHRYAAKHLFRGVKEDVYAVLAEYQASAGAKTLTTNPVLLETVEAVCSFEGAGVDTVSTLDEAAIPKYGSGYIEKKGDRVRGALLGHFTLNFDYKLSVMATVKDSASIQRAAALLKKLANGWYTFKGLDLGEGLRVDRHSFTKVDINKEAARLHKLVAKPLRLYRVGDPGVRGRQGVENRVVASQRAKRANTNLRLAWLTGTAGAKVPTIEGDESLLVLELTEEIVLDKIGKPLKLRVYFAGTDVGREDAAVEAFNKAPHVTATREGRSNFIQVTLDPAKVSPVAWPDARTLRIHLEEILRQGGVELETRHARRADPRGVVYPKRGQEKVHGLRRQQAARLKVQGLEIDPKTSRLRRAKKGWKAMGENLDEATIPKSGKKIDVSKLKAEREAAKIPKHIARGHFKPGYLWKKGKRWVIATLGRRGAVNVIDPKEFVNPPAEWSDPTLNFIASLPNGLYRVHAQSYNGPHIHPAKGVKQLDPQTELERYVATKLKGLYRTDKPGIAGYQQQQLRIRMSQEYAWRRREAMIDWLIKTTGATMPSAPPEEATTSGSVGGFSAVPLGLVGPSPPPPKLLPVVQRRKRKRVAR